MLRSTPKKAKNRILELHRVKAAPLLTGADSWEMGGQRLFVDFFGNMPEALISLEKLWLPAG